MGKWTDVEENCDTLYLVWKTPDTTTGGVWKSQKKGGEVPSPRGGGEGLKNARPPQQGAARYSDVTGKIGVVENSRSRAFPGCKAPLISPAAHASDVSTVTPISV